MKRGEQYALKRETPHRLQAGNDGAILSGFPTSSTRCFAVRRLYVLQSLDLCRRPDLKSQFLP
ncbi:MAG: hypothetical protein QOJ99_1979 [Bryobacterales bacterium]|jgi:hypothetical protein|nr:hypothetical protein [Bryobacterales bacterium]